MASKLTFFITFVVLTIVVLVLLLGIFLFLNNPWSGHSNPKGYFPPNSDNSSHEVSKEAKANISDSNYYSPSSDSDDLRHSYSYMENTQGPCEENQILTPISLGNDLWACHCNNFPNERTLIYHNGTKSCHYIFTKAYCPPGEWLILKKTNNSNERVNAVAQCVPNPCLSLSRKEFGTEWAQLRDGGPCVELGAKHPSCRNEDDVIRFFILKIYPAFSEFQCPPGYSSFHGHCILEFDFD